MKKIIVIVISCFLILSTASAEYLDDFNIYAIVFGAPEISDGTESIANGETVTDYSSAGCRIIFFEADNHLKSVTVIGTGNPFLSYCAAAIMQIDPSSDNRTMNYGSLLSAYLLAIADDTGEDHIAMTVSGAVMGIHKSGEECVFIISVVN